MDEQTRERFERIEAILASTAQQQAQNSRDIAEFRQEMSQQLQLWSILRQTIADQNRMVQNNRADIAQHVSDPQAHGEGDRDE